jgi:hypothetical protein
MTFEFIIACDASGETDIKQSIANLLVRVLEDNQYGFDEVDPASLIQFRYQRNGDEVAHHPGAARILVLIGFELTLPEYIPSEEDERERQEAEERHNTFTSSVVADFAKELPDTPPVFHAVKFEDPLLRASLADRAAEIFAVEMKLRRVLSFIYLHAYQSELPYDLLREEQVNTAPQNLSAQQMMRALENQFFHINFSQYIRLNNRTPIRLGDVIELITNSEQYDNFRAEILRTPINNDQDVNCLADIKQFLEPIEDMRNCVAHNRRPTRRILDSFPDALERLNKRLNQYLSIWKVP